MPLEWTRVVWKTVPMVHESETGTKKPGLFKRLRVRTARARRTIRNCWRMARYVVTAFIRNVGGFIYYAGKRFYDDNCFQTASALTYAALLAMVPLMTIGFAIFSAFPAFNRFRIQAQEILFSNLVPEVGSLIQEHLSDFMNNAGQSTVFGVIGLAFSAIVLLSTIEGAFGSIWRVTEPRPLLMRFLSFWALLTFSPLLFGASLSITSSFITEWHASGGLASVPDPLAAMSGYMPLLFEFVGFTLVYMIIPNRVVLFADAVIGGAVAASVLELSKACFVWYLHAFPAYATIYGALSTIPIFLVWLYISWSTILVGAVITAALPEWRAGKISRNRLAGLAPASRLVVALAVLRELLAASRESGVGLRRRQLVECIRVGSVLVEGMLEQLQEVNWVARTTQDTWVVTRDLSGSSLFDLQDALGIGIRGDPRELHGLNADFLDRCGRIIEAAVNDNRRKLGVNLKELLVDAPALEPGPGQVRLDDHDDQNDNAPVPLPLNRKAAAAGE